MTVVRASARGAEIGTGRKLTRAVGMSERSMLLKIKNLHPSVNLCRIKRSRSQTEQQFRQASLRDSRIPDVMEVTVRYVPSGLRFGP
jgi:hypothetical protein